jgi:signal transduction histidine kinase
LHSVRCLCYTIRAAVLPTRPAEHIGVPPFAFTYGIRNMNPMAPLTVATPLDRQILDSLPVTIYTTDLDGRVTFDNRKGAPLPNCTREVSEEAGTDGEPIPIWLAIAELAPRERIEDAMRVLRAGHTQRVAWELTSDEHISLVQICPLAEGHNVTGFVFCVVDTTASHRFHDVLIDSGIALAQTLSRDRVLQEAAQQLRRAIGCDAVAIAVATDDPASARLAYQVGFEHDQQTLERLLGPQWSLTLESGREQANAQPTVVSRTTDIGAEITTSMRSGTVRGAITTLITLDSSQRRDDTERVLATVGAQTASALERVELVARLGEKRRLEAIGEVAAGVAHELRNPLFGISSAAQLLRYRVREDPVVEKNVGRILREVERLNGMVTSLLEYGRPAPSRMAAANPDEVWDRVLETYRGVLESKALVLRHSAARPPVLCHLDTEQMAQAFGHILANAIDAAPEGSDLSLASAPEAHERWRCRLHNAGPAIAADALPHIFELFFSTKPGGTGIGLALCQRIIEEHGGSVTVESTPESGTTVTVVLPTAEASS